MKHLLISFIILLVYNSTFGQAGIINPRENFINQTDDTIFYMPRSKVMEFKLLETKHTICLAKIDKYKNLVENYNKRILLCDSTNILLRIESNIWQSKLMANDMAFEEEHKVNIQLNKKNSDIKKSRIYYFLAGVVATSIVIVAVK